MNSDIPFGRDTFHEHIKQFEVFGPGENNILINHHFLEKIEPQTRGDENKIYQKTPWAIYRIDDTIIYEWIHESHSQGTCYRKIITNLEHTVLDIYNGPELADRFSKGRLKNISLLPTDQIFLGRVLAYYKGIIVHSLGLVIDSKGYLFVGHSGAGKSTMANLMKKKAVILCDDRNIIRKTADRHILYGTWRHSDFPEVSALSAPLRGIFFLNQSDTNQVILIKDRKIKIMKILNCLVKPLTTSDWWEAVLSIIDDVATSVDCWDLEFDKSGGIIDCILKIN